MKPNVIRLWGVRCGKSGRILRWNLLSIVFLIVINSTCADIQPIDVEPAIKKEQPDFEDDTGAMGVGPMPGSPLREAPHKSAISVSAKPASTAKATMAVIEEEMNFMHAFVASLFIIVVSELGDKTFFISAIMAMSHPRMIVFAGAMTALAGMHVMSAMFGYVITIIPRMYTFYASSALFAIFGLKMLRDGWNMAADEGKEEMEEVQTDLRKRDDNYEREPLEEGGAGQKRGSRNRILGLVSRVFLQAFTLNVLAEWGDRSQIATVLMAAREDLSGVLVGGLIGHFLCTGLAVMGGRMIAARISVRTVTLIGGVVFLLFAVSALIIGP